MRERSEYIPAPQYWKDMFCQRGLESTFAPVDKVPIRKIRIDKRLFSYRNEVSRARIEEMLDNFDEELWIPITVNRDFFLLDGQHRLKVAKQLGLKYIDVVIEYQKRKRLR
jgi:ParB-like chromosome segregation protein Spo0J